MSETKSTGAPRWKEQLEATLKNDDAGATYYDFSIMEADRDPPFLRTHGVRHRAFMSPVNESDVLLQTTIDLRAPGASKIRSTPDAASVHWWLPKSEARYRLKCTAYLLPHPSHPACAEFPVLQLGPNVDWETERLKAYDALPGALRALFCCPLWGKKHWTPEDAQDWPTELPMRAEAKDGTEKEKVDEALMNFAVLLLEPSEVEVIEYKPVPKLRTKYVKDGDGWTESLFPQTAEVEGTAEVDATAEVEETAEVDATSPQQPTGG